MSTPSPRAAKARRRQRSTRVTVAVLLIVLSALFVLGAVLTGSWLLVTLAAALSVVLGGAATRIMQAELTLTRVEAARDRAEQAQSYRSLAVARAAENARFVADLAERIATRESTIAALEVALAEAHTRAAEATRKMSSEARRADLAEQAGSAVAAQLEVADARAAEAGLRVAELEQELDVLRAELVVWQTTPARRHA